MTYADSPRRCGGECGLRLRQNPMPLLLKLMMFRSIEWISAAWVIQHTGTQQNVVYRCGR